MKKRQEMVDGAKRVALHPVEGSRFGIWRIEMARECLACDVLFWSRGSDHRVCPNCSEDELYQDLAVLIERNMVPLYDYELDSDWEPSDPEQVMQEVREAIAYQEAGSFWERERKLGKALKCPRCGEIVYRPGSADSHPCFVESQNDLERVIRDLRGL